MTKKTDEKIDKILEKLNWVFPDVFVLPVNSLEMESSIHFIPVNDICYITTDSNSDYRLMYKMKNGLEFFSNHQLKQITDKLETNPRFLRTQKSYLINLTLIARMEYSDSRDLWFSDFPDPVKNAVSLKYLDTFKQNFEDLYK